MALENKLGQMSFLTEQSDSNKSGINQQLQDEIAQWKQKYEALAKLYGQLRKEHLDLLTKQKEIRDSSTKITDDHRRDMDKLRNDNRVTIKS